jgi:hypothetical protein
MAGQGANEEQRSEVRRLSRGLDEAREQLGALRIRITACSALALLLASLIVPMYSEIDDDETGSTNVTLAGLAGKAADAGNGAVQALAVIAIIGLILTMVLTLASIFDGDRLIGWAQGAVAGLLLAVWLVLSVAVNFSDGTGFFDEELGFDLTLRTALVPAGAAMSLIALRVARQVREFEQRDAEPSERRPLLG